MSCSGEQVRDAEGGYSLARDSGSDYYLLQGSEYRRVIDYDGEVFLDHRSPVEGLVSRPPVGELVEVIPVSDTVANGLVMKLLAITGGRPCPVQRLAMVASPDEPLVRRDPWTRWAEEAMAQVR